MLQTLKSKAFVAAAVGLSVLSLAGVASADELTDAVTDTQSKVVSYAAPIAAAVVAVSLAFVAVRLIPRVIRMISNRLG